MTKRKLTPKGITPEQMLDEQYYDDMMPKQLRFVPPAPPTPEQELEAGGFETVRLSVLQEIYQKGNLAAVVEALDGCCRYGLVPPAWVALGVHQLWQSLQTPGGRPREWDAHEKRAKLMDDEIEAIAAERSRRKKPHQEYEQALREAAQRLYKRGDGKVTARAYRDSYRLVRDWHVELSTSYQPKK